MFMLTCNPPAAYIFSLPLFDVSLGSKHIQLWSVHTWKEYSHSKLDKWLAVADRVLDSRMHPEELHDLQHVV